jgi:hypothetical protein
MIFSIKRFFQLISHEEISFSSEEKKTPPLQKDVTDDGNISIMVPRYVFNGRQEKVLIYRTKLFHRILSLRSDGNTRWSN